jgi:lipoprotein-anchoring transpeptidase ErfK/SrfK
MRATWQTTRTGLTSLAHAGLMAVVTVAIATPPPSIASQRAVVGSNQEIAVLIQAQTAVLLGEGTSKARRVLASRPITGEQTALPVLAHSVTAAGVRRLLVMLPGRPNGTRGWIHERGTRRGTTEWRVVVSTGRHRLLVYERGRLVRDVAASVGAPGTPTPHGHFFVEESVRMPAGAAGGPFALALSAHSNVLRTFEGGSGQIAIHGLEYLDGALGTASSHGCVRVADKDITWLAARLAPGVPVDVGT